MTTTFEHADDAELHRKLVASVEVLGYIVTKIEPPDRVTVGELSQLLGRRTRSISRSLSRATCPPFACKRTTTGRLIWIAPTENLMTFLKSK